MTISISSGEIEGTVAGDVFRFTTSGPLGPIQAEMRVSGDEMSIELRGPGFSVAAERRICGASIDPLPLSRADRTVIRRCRPRGRSGAFLLSKVVDVRSAHAPQEDRHGRSPRNRDLQPSLYEGTPIVRTDLGAISGAPTGGGERLGG